jgi:hypothetical protein
MSYSYSILKSSYGIFSHLRINFIHLYADALILVAFFLQKEIDGKAHFFSPIFLRMAWPLAGKGRDSHS